MRTRHAVTVVTGASSGIGRATARAFAGRGAALVLAARREDGLAQLAAECEEQGAETLVVPTDVTDPKAVDELARRAVESFGRIDVWVNNAAVAMFSPVLEMPLPDVRRLLDVNVLGYLHGARAALRQMRAQGTGVLVNVSSIVAVVAQPYTSAYSMSKAAVRSLSTSLRSELLLDGYRKIKVCTVLPATIDTPLFRQTANYTGREALAMAPAYRPQRVARTIVSLVRMPRREAVVGPMGRLVLAQNRLAPGMTERMFARQVDKRHLSQVRPAAAGSGNLYEPASDPELATVHGGYAARQRIVPRALAGTALAIAGGYAVHRWRNRD